jgi:hypothetical protein
MIGKAGASAGTASGHDGRSRYVTTPPAISNKAVSKMLGRSQSRRAFRRGWPAARRRACPAGEETWMTIRAFGCRESLADYAMRG